MPLRAQRPERCVSTNFTTSAFAVVLRDVDYNIVSRWPCQEDCRPFFGKFQNCQNLVGARTSALAGLRWNGQTCYNSEDILQRRDCRAGTHARVVRGDDQAIFVYF